MRYSSFFGMGLIPVYSCINGIMNGFDTKDTKEGKSTRIIYIKDNKANQGEATGERERRVIYQIPSICHSCRGILSTENVDWIGPLEARCPFCGVRIKMQRREI